MDLYLNAMKQIKAENKEPAPPELSLAAWDSKEEKPLGQTMVFDAVQDKTKTIYLLHRAGAPFVRYGQSYKLWCTKFGLSAQFTPQLFEDDKHWNQAFVRDDKYYVFEFQRDCQAPREGCHFVAFTCYPSRIRPTLK